MGRCNSWVKVSSGILFVSDFAGGAYFAETIHMEIKHVEKNDRGGFLVRNEDGKRVAEMTYVTAGDSAFIIDHTEVDPSLRGQGVAEKLLDAAVKHARDNKLKIHATCHFALKKLQEEEEFKDVFGG